MSYVIEALGALGAVGADARALVAQASPGAIPLKMKLSDNVKAQPNLTRYQHFNLIRFNKAIKNSKDPELVQRMSKGDYDQFYKDWRAMIRKPLKTMRKGAPGTKAQKDDKRPRWSNGELNALLYDEFKAWYRELRPTAAAPSGPGAQASVDPGAQAPVDTDTEVGEGSADTASTSDNTMLYVGIGAALLLVAFSMNKAR